MTPDAPPPSRPLRVFLLGATGTIGQATAAALIAKGVEVVAFVRPRADSRPAALPPGVILREGQVTDPASLRRDGLRGERFDALVSCLASRTGAPRDAARIDRDATIDAISAARAAGATQAVLLSAICVQRPLLAFQRAKLEAEAALIDSGLRYSIVRPTAFFKSLSGQVARVQAGKPFLLFGNGRLTACKPISDDDLGRYMADCLDDPTRANRILPIGGPGPAITPLEQGEWLFRRLGLEPKFRHVPVAMMDVIIAGLSLAGKLVPKAADKAEFARIGRYYATESMLVWDPAANRYDAEATPETGRETLFDYYERLLRGETRVDLGDHAMF